CSPASTSLIGDLVPTSQRARAIAVWMLGLPLGLGLANGAGGWILQNWGWRNAFYVAAIPGILCAIFAVGIGEPPRGKKEEHAIGNQKREGHPYWLVLSIPTMLWIIASGALHNFNMYALGAFVAPFIVRFHHVSFHYTGWIAPASSGFSRTSALPWGGGLRRLRHPRPGRGRCPRRSPLSHTGRRPPDRRLRRHRHLHAAHVHRAGTAGGRPPRLRAADGRGLRRDVRVL